MAYSDYVGAKWAVDPTVAARGFRLSCKSDAVPAPAKIEAGWRLAMDRTPVGGVKKVWYVDIAHDVRPSILGGRYEFDVTTSTPPDDTKYSYWNPRFEPYVALTTAFSDVLTRVGAALTLVDLRKHFTVQGGSSKLTYSASPLTSVVAKPAALVGWQLKLNPAATGHVTFSVSATDATGKTARNNFNFVVTAANQPPASIAAIGNPLVRPGQNVTIDLSRYFSDPDGDALTYAVTGPNVPGLIYQLQGAGRDHLWIEIPGGTPEGSNWTLLVTATDPSGAHAAQQVHVTVHTDKPPVAKPIPAQAIVPGQRRTVDLSDYFSDPERDPISYYIGFNVGAPGDQLHQVLWRYVSIVGTSTITLESLYRWPSNPGFTDGVANGTRLRVLREGAAAVTEFTTLGAAAPATWDRATRRLRVVVGTTVDATALVAMQDVQAVVLGQGADVVRPHVRGVTERFTLASPLSSGDMQVVAILPRRDSGVAHQWPASLVVGGHARMIDRSLTTVVQSAVAQTTTYTFALAAPWDGPDADTGDAVLLEDLSAYGEGTDLVLLPGTEKGTVSLFINAYDPALKQSGGELVGVTLHDPVETVGTIPDLLLDAGEDAAFDLDRYFLDPDGGRLTFTAAADDPGSVKVLVQDATLHVHGNADGASMLTVTATDPEGSTVDQVFDVVVTAREGLEQGAFAGADVYNFVDGMLAGFTMRGACRFVLDKPPPHPLGIYTVLVNTVSAPYYFYPVGSTHIRIAKSVSAYFDNAQPDPPRIGESFSDDFGNIYEIAPDGWNRALDGSAIPGVEQVVVQNVVQGQPGFGSRVGWQLSLVNPLQETLAQAGQNPLSWLPTRGAPWGHINIVIPTHSLAAYESVGDFTSTFLARVSAAEIDRATPDGAAFGPGAVLAMHGYEWTVIKQTPRYFAGENLYSDLQLLRTAVSRADDPPGLIIPDQLLDGTVDVDVALDLTQYSTPQLSGRYGHDRLLYTIVDDPPPFGAAIDSAGVLTFTFPAGAVAAQLTIRATVVESGLSVDQTFALTPFVPAVPPSVRPGIAAQLASGQVYISAGRSLVMDFDALSRQASGLGGRPAAFDGDRPLVYTVAVSGDGASYMSYIVNGAVITFTYTNIPRFTKTTVIVTATNSGGSASITIEVGTF